MAISSLLCRTVRLTATFAICTSSVLASAQPCTELMRHPAASVSAAQLQVPSKAWQHFEKARIASERNQSDLVRREIDQALALAPRFTEAYVLLAAQQVRDQHYEVALQTVVNARAIQSDVPWSASWSPAP